MDLTCGDITCEITAVVFLGGIIFFLGPMAEAPSENWCCRCYKAMQNLYNSALSLRFLWVKFDMACLPWKTGDVWIFGCKLQATSSVAVGDDWCVIYTAVGCLRMSGMLTVFTPVWLSHCCSLTSKHTRYEWEQVELQRGLRRSVLTTNVPLHAFYLSTLRSGCLQTSVLFCLQSVHFLF